MLDALANVVSLSGVEVFRYLLSAIADKKIKSSDGVLTLLEKISAGMSMRHSLTREHICIIRRMVGEEPNRVVLVKILRAVLIRVCEAFKLAEVTSLSFQNMIKGFNEENFAIIAPALLFLRDNDLFSLVDDTDSDKILCLMDHMRLGRQYKNIRRLIGSCSTVVQIERVFEHIIVPRIKPDPDFSTIKKVLDVIEMKRDLLIKARLNTVQRMRIVLACKSRLRFLSTPRG